MGEKTGEESVQPRPLFGGERRRFGDIRDADRIHDGSDCRESSLIIEFHLGPELLHVHTA